MTLKDFFVAGPYDDGDPVTGHCYEMAAPDATRAQVWGYTDKISYAPGETLVLHAMSAAPVARLSMVRSHPKPLAAPAVATAAWWNIGAARVRSMTPGLASGWQA